MTLPSPCFVEKPAEPAAIKSHVRDDNKKQTSRFVEYCKFCREGFVGTSELIQHRKAHERCPYDNCKFNASEKVVAEHIQRVHMKSNTLVKIQDLTTPEQIEKWREERRKRYPTTANVLLRQQAQEERFSRGEKLQDRQQRFGNVHQRNSDNRQQQRDKPNQQRKNHRQQRRKVDSQDEKAPAEPPTRQVLLPLPVPERPALESSDDEPRATPSFKGTSKMKDFHNLESIVKEQAALSILGMYGSDSEGDAGSQPEEIVVQQPGPADDDGDDVDDDEMQINDGDDEAPVEIPIGHQPDSTPSASSKVPRKRKHENPSLRKDSKRKPQGALDFSKLRHKPSTNPFLEKLLEQDMRHERNVLLQCVNFVVKKNFFGVGQPKSEEVTNNL